MRNHIFSVLMTVASAFFVTSAAAQDNGYDVFYPIAKYIEKGDAEKLSAWFSDNLEITIFSDSNDSSRNQARQIIKTSFNS